MDSSTIVPLILSSTLAVAVVTALKEIIIWIFNRVASKKDKLEDKQDSKDELMALLKKLEVSTESTSKSVETLGDKLNDYNKLSIKCFKVLYMDRIRTIAAARIREGFISIEDKKTMHDLHSIYHNELEGNGFFDQLMADIDELPVVDHY